MSRYLFRLAASVEPWEVREAWRRSPVRGDDRLWINMTDRPAVLSACLLGDDPCVWWHGPGGGCVYFEDETERAGLDLFFDIYIDYFDRVEFDSG